VALAVLDSVFLRKGLTFSVEIARQGGKDELSAQLELLLLTLHMAESKNLVKCSPTFKPQTIISMTRLKDRLNDAGFNSIWVVEIGYIIRLGNARAIFLSADESANVVDHTADILLEIDESQDVSKEKYTKEFKPMGAATNITTVHYGTTWDESTLLGEIKQTNYELQKKDGIKRHFRYDWQEVAKHNPDYLAYVEGERARLGETHPLSFNIGSYRYAMAGDFSHPNSVSSFKGNIPENISPKLAIFTLPASTSPGRLRGKKMTISESSSRARTQQLLLLANWISLAGVF
jgi:hypothetical protein